MSLHAFECFVGVLDSLRLWTSNVFSGLGPYRLILHFSGLWISNPKFIISVLFTSRPNQVVTILISKPIHGRLRWQPVRVCFLPASKRVARSLRWQVCLFLFYFCFSFHLFCHCFLLCSQVLWLISSVVGRLGLWVVVRETMFEWWFSVCWAVCKMIRGQFRWLWDRVQPGPFEPPHHHCWHRHEVGMPLASSWCDDGAPRGWLHGLGDPLDQWGVEVDTIESKYLVVDSEGHDCWVGQTSGEASGWDTSGHFWSRHGSSPTATTICEPPLRPYTIPPPLHQLMRQYIVPPPTAK